MGGLARLIRPFTWRRRFLFLLAGIVAGVSLLVLCSAQPLAYLLRVRIRSLLAGEPEISLDFVRDPSDEPVLGSGTAMTPMIVMDACVLPDADGLHLFFSTFFCRTATGLSPFWTPETGPQFDPRTLTTGIAYAFSADHGKTWTVRPKPVLLPVSEGWDDYRVETASAVVAEDTLYLFYCADGKSKPARYQIGAASLPLNRASLLETLLVREKSPRRVRTTPILSGVTERSSFLNNTQEPSVLHHQGRFELYFVGIQFSQPADAADASGQTMRRVGLGRALVDKSLHLIEVTERPLLDLANIVEIKRDGERLLLFTTLAGEGSAHRGESIGYHTSRDGRSWSCAPTGSVLAPNGIRQLGLHVAHRLPG